MTRREPSSDGQGTRVGQFETDIRYPTIGFTAVSAQSSRHKPCYCVCTPCGLDSSTGARPRVADQTG